jgi:hypothetical protein
LDGKLDLGISIAEYQRDLSTVIDFTTYVYINEVIFNVCYPRRIPGHFNIVRPFR